MYIHGGGFYGIGSSSKWLGPQYLLDKEVVLVTFNYRLATLGKNICLFEIKKYKWYSSGFLSTGDKEAPGNNGLKDQVEVLKWVKQHIEHFGGDPNSVAIMGNDFGAWSVVLHMVSPMSQGIKFFIIILQFKYLLNFKFTKTTNNTQLWRHQKVFFIEIFYRIVS